MDQEMVKDYDDWEKVDPLDFGADLARNAAGVPENLIDMYKKLPDANRIPQDLYDAETARLNLLEAQRRFSEAWLKARKILMNGVAPPDDPGWTPQELRKAGFRGIQHGW